MILDTNALSDFLKPVEGLRRHMESAEIVCIPVIVLGEFRFGLRSSRQRRILEAELDSLLVDVVVLPIREETTPIYAKLRAELKTAGTPIPSNDVWIAALVRDHKMQLLSNDHHFDHVRGIERLEW